MSHQTPHIVHVEGETEIPTAALVRETLAEAKTLLRDEMRLAQEEAKLDLAQAKRASIVLAFGALAAIVGLSLAATAIVLAFGGTVLAALLVGAAFVAIGGGLAAAGYARMPKDPLSRTRQRLVADIAELGGHIA